jgi:hypothetical protein
MSRLKQVCSFTCLGQNLASAFWQGSNGAAS